MDTANHAGPKSDVNLRARALWHSCRGLGRFSTLAGGADWCRDSARASDSALAEVMGSGE